MALMVACDGYAIADSESLLSSHGPPTAAVRHLVEGRDTGYAVNDAVNDAVNAPRGCYEPTMTYPVPCLLFCLILIHDIDFTCSYFYE